MGFIADVFDVTLIDPITKEAFASTTLQEANIEFTLDSNDIRGGKGNALLGVLHSNRDIVINLTEVSFKYDWLARQMGTDIVTGASVAHAVPKFYKVENGNTITLPNKPVGELGVFLYTLDNKKITGFTISENKINLETATPKVEIGDEVEVRAYQYETPASTETIEFDIAKYPKGSIVMLDTIEIDGDETITHQIQYQFDNAVPDGNFTLNTASEREAQTTEMALRVIKPKTSTKVGRALRFPYVEETKEDKKENDTP